MGSGRGTILSGLQCSCAPSWRMCDIHIDTARHPGQVGFQDSHSSTPRRTKERPGVSGAPATKRTKFRSRPTRKIATMQSEGSSSHHWISDAGEAVQRQQYYISPPPGQKFSNDTKYSKIIGYLEPADIILIQGGTRIIENFHIEFKYPENASTITHCAIYLGRGKICHAVPISLSNLRFGGIKIDSLRSYLTVNPERGPKDEILRDFYVVRAENLDHISRLQIALLAATYAGRHSAYNYGQIINCLEHWIKRRLEQDTHQNHTMKAILRFLKKHTTGRAQDNRAPLQRERYIFVHNLEDHPWTSPKYIREWSENFEIATEVSEFICSDFVFSIYDQCLGASNPLHVKKGTRTPLFLPADIFINASLVTVTNIENVDPLSTFIRKIGPDPLTLDNIPTAQIVKLGDHGAATQPDE